MISFRIDWFDLPAVQGTLTSHSLQSSSKALILQSYFLYMFIETTKEVTLWASIGQVMSSLLKTSFKFVIAFLSRKKKKKRTKQLLFMLSASSVNLV